MKNESWFNMPKRKLIQPKKLMVGPSELNGYGVFATKNINKMEIVEEAPFWMAGMQDKGPCFTPNLRQICYSWECACKAENKPECESMCSRNGNQVLISSGLIQIYNHSLDPDVLFVYNYRKRYISVRAVKNIPEGKEVLHNYGDSYDNFGAV